MASKKALFVLTSHDRLGPAGDESADRTGFHLSEAAHVWSTLTDAGIGVDIATPTGRFAPIDPSSKDLDDADNVRFLNDPAVGSSINRGNALPDIDLTGYDAIYFPGGHGTMWDLPDDPAVQEAVRSVYGNGGVVAAVCHGPAALVNVRLPDGSWLVDGRTISVFTDSEERATGKDRLMPFLLASRLEERGATINAAPDFEASVSVDGRLVTGQNPASARGVGHAILELIRHESGRAA